MVSSIITFIGTLFNTWIHTLFLVPFENYDMLWLLIPIWLAWFFAEFFQEKVGTSMGNAITNAVVILWGSIDCARQTVNFIIQKQITNTFNIIARFFLIFFLFLYGFIIIHYGIKGNPIIKKIGRVRNITYVFAMFVPIFYNAIPFSLNHILAAILFFPLFYYFIEAIDRIVPNPKAVEQDLMESSSSNIKSNIKKDIFDKRPTTTFSHYNNIYGRSQNYNNYSTQPYTNKQSQSFSGTSHNSTQNNYSHTTKEKK
ncbi:MAG: hypothetical protein QXE31_00150 [Candidatus Woesearchaeota archaeon]